MTETKQEEDDDDHCTCYMYGLSPLWNASTIALLLHKHLWMPCHNDDDKIDDCNNNNNNKHHDNPDDDKESSWLQVELLPLSTTGDDDAKNKTRTARLVFANPRILQVTVQAYQGVAIPGTHGYHYYDFGTQQQHHQQQQSSSSLSSSTTVMLQQTPSPPLHLQLLALSTGTLEQRLAKQSQFSLSHTNLVLRKDKKNKKKQRVLYHAQLAHALTVALEQPGRCRPRPVQYVDGVPLDSTVTQPLLAFLRSTTAWNTVWATCKPRKGVQAARYMTLRQSALPRKDDDNHPVAMATLTLWTLCRNVLQSVVVVHDAPYTALAITANFTGSPHIDAHDTTVQYVVALGDFCGGELCVDEQHNDSDNDCKNEEKDEEENVITQINIHNRLGRLEGRQVHWVQGWQGRDRYSIVYYSTSADHYTPVQRQSVHNAWMLKRQSQVQEKVMADTLLGVQQKNT